MGDEIMDSLVVVDCQYDFIEGTLACQKGREAVRYLLEFINTHKVNVFYTGDWHSPTNRSFKINGGIWPVHCVAGSKGAMLDSAFYEDVKEEVKRPKENNFFMKGQDDLVEEYSAFHGKNKEGKELNQVASSHVYVGGLASEYCVKETILAFVKAHHTVTWLLSGTGYVDKDDHEKTIKELREMGIEIIE